MSDTPKDLCWECTGSGLMGGGYPCKICRGTGYLKKDATKGSSDHVEITLAPTEKYFPVKGDTVVMADKSVWFVSKTYPDGLQITRVRWYHRLWWWLKRIFNLKTWKIKLKGLLK